jgi:hypothetical protein
MGLRKRTEAGLNYASYDIEGMESRAAFLLSPDAPRSGNAGYLPYV